MYTDVALVLEYAAGGGLFERLVSEGCYNEQRAARIVRQITLAVYHCHSRGVVHRDVKVKPDRAISHLVAPEYNAAPSPAICSSHSSLPYLAAPCCDPLRTAARAAA